MLTLPSSRKTVRCISSSQQAKSNIDFTRSLTSDPFSFKLRIIPKKPAKTKNPAATQGGVFTFFKNKLPYPASL